MIKMAHPDYLKKILTSRVYDVAQESPLEVASVLSQRLGNTVLLKREDMQSVFSLICGVVVGITMTASQPKRCAASATPCA